MVDVGSVFLKTSENEFTTILDTLKTTTHDPTGNTGISEASTEGLLTYYYNQNTISHGDVASTLGNAVVSYSSGDGCGKPWLCTYDNAWNAATEASCMAKHRAWFEQRSHFETVNWEKEDYVNTTAGEGFYYDVFYGYCTETGEVGYQNGALHQSVELTYRVEVPGSDGDALELVLNSTDIDGDGKVTLSLPLSSSGELLIMSSRFTDTSVNTHAPMGRSYDGHDWEKVAGPYESILSYSCTNGVPKQCFVEIELVENQSFYITQYKYEISDEAKVARFLESVTFGATQDLIDNFDYSNLPLSRAQFVRDQILEPVTSHREYYRARANPPQAQTSFSGVSGPHPCNENSRWRRFAFTREDMEMNNKGYDKFNLTITTETSGANTEYVLSVAGNIRTILKEPLKWYDSFINNITADLDMNNNYKICYVEEIEGSRRPEVNDIFPDLRVICCSLLLLNLLFTLS